MPKRIFDVTVSFFSLILLLPVLAGAAILVKFSSQGPVFFKQTRVGLHKKHFLLFKFRTMYSGSDKNSRLTIGSDQRITPIGRHLRNWKIDELPQLFNVLLGEMSLVGPRPEVPEYVALYPERFDKVLQVRPGITDYASVKFFNENDLLSKYPEPEKAYQEIILPQKLDLNEQYVNKNSLFIDLHIIGLTIKRMFVSAKENKK